MKHRLLTPLRQQQFYILISITGLLAFYFLIMDSAFNVKKSGKYKAHKISDEVVKDENFSFNSGSQKEPTATVAVNSSQSIDQRTNKLILLWSPLFSGWKFLETGKNSFKNSECSETRCEITSDRNRFAEADAILFHIRTMSLLDVPRNRTSNQKWIFFSLEAPVYSHFHGFAFMSGMFNWTMTYRSDSDVVIQYGKAVRNGRVTYNESGLYSQWKNKSSMAVWMVSHCSTSGNREGFIGELKNHIDVTTYGECGVAVCSFNKTNECLENFSRRFYFYLALENAICDEYVTEKFYRVLNYNMIPVVFGGGVYSSIAPPHSYINALEFKSVEELSFHLLQVATNFSLFKSYFQWKLDGYIIEDFPNHCDLCKKLHSVSFHEKTSHTDLSEWWIKKSHCRKWKRA